MRDEMATGATERPAETNVAAADVVAPGADLHPSDISGDTTRRSSSLPWMMLGFAASYAVFIIVPALLTHPVGAEPSMTRGDVLDLATPLVLAAWYLALYSTEPIRDSTWAKWGFLFAMVFFIEGHGLHLAANSIRHYLEVGSDADRYAYFFDGVLSHIIWRIGTVGLAALLIWRHTRTATLSGGHLAVGAAALLYGLTTAISAVEGQTVPLDLPSSVVIAAVLAFWWRRIGRLPGDAVFAALGLAYALAMIALIGWGIYWGGFPEFSELGWID